MCVYINTSTQTGSLKLLKGDSFERKKNSVSHSLLLVCVCVCVHSWGPPKAKSPTCGGGEAQVTLLSRRANAAREPPTPLVDIIIIYVYWTLRGAIHSRDMRANIVYYIPTIYISSAKCVMPCAHHRHARINDPTTHRVFVLCGKIICLHRSSPLIILFPL